MYFFFFKQKTAYEMRISDWSPYVCSSDLLIGDGVTDDAMYRSNLSSAVEVRANRMAADILMPWHLIREATDKGIDTVERLAEYFDVSRSTMSIQLGVPYETKTYA